MPTKSEEDIPYPPRIPLKKTVVDRLFNHVKQSCDIREMLTTCTELPINYYGSLCESVLAELDYAGYNVQRTDDREDDDDICYRIG